jgi:hypothetical protein
MSHQFGNEACELKKPQFYLVQSAKDGGDDPRGGAAGEFVCYKAKCADSTPQIPNPTDRESQFGAHSLESKKAKLVCLPVEPPPPPCGGVLVAGSCWYAGAPGASCDATCALAGDVCASATLTSVGSAGTNSECTAILFALGATSPRRHWMADRSRLRGGCRVTNPRHHPGDLLRRGRLNRSTRLCM